MVPLHFINFFVERERWVKRIITDVSINGVIKGSQSPGMVYCYSNTVLVMEGKSSQLFVSWLPSCCHILLTSLPALVTFETPVECKKTVGDPLVRTVRYNSESPH